MRQSLLSVIKNRQCSHSYLTRIEFEFWIQSLDAVHGEGQAAHVGQQGLLVQVRLQEPAQSNQL
jgi:hypothetical protein